MGFFDKVKGAFIEDDAEPVQIAPTPSAPPAPSTPSPAAAPLQYQMSPSMNQDMYDAVQKAVYGKSTAFTTVMTAADALKELVPDPALRLKIAFKSSGNGKSPKEIADAVTLHISAVDSEVARFEDALKSKRSEVVDLMMKQAGDVDASITSLQQEAQTLSQRIQEIQNIIGQKTGEAAQLRAQAQMKDNELQQAENQFKNAAGKVRGELEQQRSTILTALT